MKIQLPLETWADLLPLVPRQQLVQLVKKLDDRHFVSALQFFLTEVGQIKLGHLTILAPRENDATSGPIVEVRYQLPAILSEWDEWYSPSCDMETTLAEGPMPNNVKDFKIIELRYFDPSVANFLRQFQRENEEGNSLLDNVNLWFYPYLSISPRGDDNTLVQIIGQIMPTIGNINSIHMCHFELHDDFEGANNYAQPLMEMLTKTRLLNSTDCNSVFSFREWLHTPRTDGKPRALRLPLSPSNTDTVQFIEDIKKDFSKATHPVSFFVNVEVVGARDDWQDGCLDNACTNERLAIKTFDPPPDEWHFPADWHFYDEVQISRYPMGATREWIEANEREIIKYNGWENGKNRRIRFGRSLKNDANMGWGK